MSPCDLDIVTIFHSWCKFSVNQSVGSLCEEIAGSEVTRYIFQDTTQISL